MVVIQEQSLKCDAKWGPEFTLSRMSRMSRKFRFNFAQNYKTHTHTHIHTYICKKIQFNF